MIRGNKISVHVQGSSPGWLPRFMEKQIYVKMINPPEENPFPGKRVIARWYIEDSETNRMVWDAEKGARDWFNIVRPEMEKRPWVWAWEHPNEPQPCHKDGIGPDGKWSILFCTRLDWFTVEAAHLMHDHGRKCGFPIRSVGLCWSVGWPDYPDVMNFAASFKAINYWGPHEYNAKTLDVVAQDGSMPWVGRYQRIREIARKNGLKTPPIFIGEFGVDLGVYTPSSNPSPITSDANRGWMAVDNDPLKYFEQIKWANDTLYYHDDDIEAVFLYTAAPYHPWESFEVTEQLADLICYFYEQPTVI